MVSEPLRVPDAVGRKLTLTVHDAPIAMEVPQVFVWRKSPVTETPETAATAVPVLVTVTACAALVVLSAWLAKVSEVSLTLVMTAVSVLPELPTVTESPDAKPSLWVTGTEVALAGLPGGAMFVKSAPGETAATGITVDCFPLADVPVAGADRVIGDRALGDTPHQVSVIAAALAAGLQSGGVLPVIKHLPGHGRATDDSHERLPVVTADREALEMIDFAAFMPLAGLPLGMTAHVEFTALDPGLPATTSSTIIAQVIRRFIGFSGALMSDDISMGALSGSIAERTRRSLAAGCDLVLHCNGNLAEMHDVATQCPELRGAALERTGRALASRRAPDDIDLREARARFSTLLAGQRGTVTA